MVRAIVGRHGFLPGLVPINAEIAGHLSIFEMSGEMEVGYWIGREHWGKGIATRALQLFLQSSTVRPLCAHVARHNVASIRVLEKCGFVEVERRAGHDEHADKVVEEILYRLD